MCTAPDSLHHAFPLRRQQGGVGWRGTLQRRQGPSAGPALPSHRVSSGDLLSWPPVPSCAVRMFPGPVSSMRSSFKPFPSAMGGQGLAREGRSPRRVLNPPSRAELASGWGDGGDTGRAAGPQETGAHPAPRVNGEKKMRGHQEPDQHEALKRGQQGPDGESRGSLGSGEALQLRSRG